MIIFVSIIIVVIAFITASCFICSPTFVFRLLRCFDSSVDDYRFFPARIISKSDEPYDYEYSLNAELENMSLNYKNHG